MRLILVRHGKPYEIQTQRAHDPSSPSIGQTQAKAAAKMLARETITHIVSSPLERAMDIASPLAESIGLPVQVLHGWAEADRSATRYRVMETLKEKGTQEWQLFLQDPITCLGADHDSSRLEVLAGHYPSRTARHRGSFYTRRADQSCSGPCAGHKQFGAVCTKLLLYHQAASPLTANHVSCERQPTLA